MPFKFSQVQIQTRRCKSKASTKTKYKKCRGCDSANLISAGPDQFCCDCDWHTCLEYVEKGYMNNLRFAYCEHFAKSKTPQSKIPDLPKGNAPIESDTTKIIQDPAKKTA